MAMQAVITSIPAWCQSIVARASGNSTRWVKWIRWPIPQLKKIAEVAAPSLFVRSWPVRCRPEKTRNDTAK